MTSPYLILPEWAAQDAIMLTWPHSATQWQPMLPEITSTYFRLAREITAHQRLIIVCHDEILASQVARNLADMGLDLRKIELAVSPSQDSWARAHGPLALQSEDGITLLDFMYASDSDAQQSAELPDSQINRSLARCGVFKAQLQTVDLPLNGSEIETDGHGTLLIADACLQSLSTHANAEPAQATALLKELLGVAQVYALDLAELNLPGQVSGIDTWVRFAPGNRMVYQTCADTDDPQFAALQALEQQLQDLRDTQNKPYERFGLPSPQPQYNANGEQLPATYASYILLNDAVLVPTYRDPADSAALEVIQLAFPHYQVIGIDSRYLIQRFGNLHQASMQLPENTLS